jgi:ribosome-associated protein
MSQAIPVTSDFGVYPEELSMTFVRSGGPGGQNVNKVSTAVQLRFDIVNSFSLPIDVKQRMITQLKSRITNDGVLVIHANRFRTQEQNREDAIQRLIGFIQKAVPAPKIRRQTKPSYSAHRRRLQSKKQTSEKKRMRSISGNSE